MGRPTLAILAPYPFVPARSGGQKAVSAYVRYLSAAWPTICLCSEGNEELPGVELIPLFPNHPRKYLDPRVGWRIRKLLMARDIKFLGIQHHYHGLLLRPFLLGTGIKTFIFSHNIEYERWRSIGKWWWPFMKMTERWVYQWADAVFFISYHEQLRAPALFGLPAAKCLYAPYPIDQAENPGSSVAVRQKVVDRHGFSPDDHLLLFFGPQAYPPNLQAVEDIVFRIHPALQAIDGFRYRILICGGGLPPHYDGFVDKATEGIHYLGFVEQIEEYVRAADVILNPVNVGGGVKTKLVEAIALGKTVVSTQTGALGVRTEHFGNKLIQVADEDWQQFAHSVVQVVTATDQPTPDTFYEEHFGQTAIRSILDWLMAKLAN